MQLFDVLGAIGAALVVGTYLLLQLGKLDPKQLPYSALNAAGAFLIVLSLLERFNVGAFLVEAFWLLISLFGIWRIARTRRPQP